jgi:uncharacterized membrane protein YkvA (DUF1232 family)
VWTSLEQLAGLRFVGVTAWQWTLLAVGVTAAVYGALLLALLAAGRKEDARTWARFVPDCAVVCARLLRDNRVPRRHKVLLVLVAAYLSLPFDLVPDFIPVIGLVDDAVVVAFALRIVLRSGEGDLVREHWPGPPASLGVMLRLAGA